MTFTKGKSGNPGGRTSGKHMSTILFKRLKEHAIDQKGNYVTDDEKKFKTWGEVIIERILMEAAFSRKINPLFHKLIFSYMDGDPEQFLDLTTGGNALPSVGESNIMELVKQISAELKKKKTNVK